MKYPVNEFINIIQENNNINDKLNINIKNEYYNYDNKSDIFPFPSKIGLTKIGKNCFLNAFLQCFCHIKNFISYFKYSDRIKNITKNNKDYLSTSFKLIIDKLWNNTNISTYYNPEEFKSKIIKMIPSFDLTTPNNIKYIIIFILTTLHKELNHVDKNINLNNNLSIHDDTVQNDKSLVLKKYRQNFFLKNKSIISDLFYSSNCNRIKCANCKIFNFNYETFFFIPFSLSSIFKYKSEHNQKDLNIYNNYNNGTISIFDCFDYYKRIISEQTFPCNRCNNNTNCFKQTNLAFCTEILILLFYNKGEEIIKLTYTNELNLFNYIEEKYTGFYFKLIGIITYIGENGKGGYFIAYCCNSFTNMWFKFDNEIYSEINDFQNIIINYSMPFLLFYQKIEYHY